MLINFQEVLSENNLKMIETLANTIWHEHYTPIIGEEQVSYMLEKFQSVKAMFAQIEHGYHYFLISDKQKPVGYLSYEKRGEVLFLK